MSHTIGEYTVEMDYTNSTSIIIKIINTETHRHYRGKLMRNNFIKTIDDAIKSCFDKDKIDAQIRIFDTSIAFITLEPYIQNVEVNLVEINMSGVLYAMIKKQDDEIAALKRMVAELLANKGRF